MKVARAGADDRLVDLNLFAITENSSISEGLCLPQPVNIVYEVRKKSVWVPRGKKEDYGER